MLTGIMHPVCFTLFGKAIHWYGIMAALGFLAAVVHWTVLGRHERLPPAFGTDLGVWLLLAGLIGSRLAFVAAEFEAFRDKPWTVFRIDQGGVVFYGGFLGGCLGAFIFSRIRHYRLWPVADFAITAIPLAHAFGRVGCFLNGCCYGSPYDGWLAVRYPDRWAPEPLRVAGQARSMPVHPVQLYESAFNVLLWLALLHAYRRRRKDGSIFGLYLVAYPIWRFAIEFLRGDPRVRVLGLSVYQWGSMLLLLIGAVLLLKLPRRRSAWVETE
ncbi:MAG: prolipoprotein diacylglyceryl transferase [Kiritimatiellae bacterium]|nr:prolipoprotein diacylglyceryl transferase [Kiritimatiellia bacterium]